MRFTVIKQCFFNAHALGKSFTVQSACHTVNVVITYDGRKEFRSRAASGHERSTCYIFAKMETL